MIKRVIVVILLLLLPSMSVAAQDTPTPIPVATAQAANVGEPGPQLRNAGQPESMANFVNMVIQDTNVMWSTMFQTWGYSYVPPIWVLVEEGAYARSNCGINSGDPGEHAGLNPSFYCIYGGELGTQVIDSSVMFDTEVTYSPVIYLSIPWLESYFSTHVLNLDVAVAYIVAHESAHHVEYLVGYMDHTGGGWDDVSDEQLELVTDCLAGVWAFSAYDTGNLDQSDIRESQMAAWGPGSDQSEEFGRTGEHGTMDQRLQSFLSGYESGSPATCFSTDFSA
jgi:uncharacterized protein